MGKGNWEHGPRAPEKPAERAATTEPSQTSPCKARKNTKRWCCGHEGRLHRYVVGIPQNVGRRTCVPRTAWRTTQVKPLERKAIGTWWSCVHRRYCEECGRVDRRSLGVECPQCPDPTMPSSPWELQQRLKEVP